MGGEEKPVFHDFLGMKMCSSEQETCSGRHKEHAASRSSGLEEEIDMSSAASRLLSGPLGLAVPSSSVSVSERLSCGKWEGLEAQGSKIALENRSLGKKRESLATSLRDSSQDALEISRGLKMSRFEAKDERMGRHIDDDVHLGMQPPRPSPACQTLIQQSMSARLDPMSPKKWERPASLNTVPAVYSPSRLTHHVGGYDERASANVLRENTLMMPTFLSRSTPADEGSRTGLKGSGIANLVNKNTPTATVAKNTSGRGPFGGSSNFLFKTGVPESSMLSNHQGTASASRQLTIFYGGQAHVFDDVHPSKADAIMALAGSNGRSWSTTYLPWPRSSAVTEGHFPAAERENVGGRITAISGSGGNVSKEGPLISCPSICSNEGDKETLCQSKQLA